MHMKCIYKLYIYISHHITSRYTWQSTARPAEGWFQVSEASDGALQLRPPGREGLQGRSRVFSWQVPEKCRENHL